MYWRIQVVEIIGWVWFVGGTLFALGPTSIGSGGIVVAGALMICTGLALRALRAE